MNHVKGVLQDHLIDEYYSWVDSTTVLRNKIKAIQDKVYLQWHQVPLGDNPSDQVNRSIKPIEMGQLWFQRDVLDTEAQSFNEESNS